ncbi:MAG: ArsC/Spx/MgsR family protein [Butyricicoccus sp.]
MLHARRRKWLDAQNKDVTVRDIGWKTPPRTSCACGAQSSLPLKKFFNTSDNLYKELHSKTVTFEMSGDEQFALLANDGMLVKRPIVVTVTVILARKRGRRSCKHIIKTRSVGRVFMAREVPGMLLFS